MHTQKSQTTSATNSVSVLPKKPLDLVKYKKKINLIISEEVQNVIRYFCSQVSRDEWSGAIFYTSVSGNFDDDELTIEAKYIHLLDIGTQAYTEYAFGPDFASFLMANPELMDMEMGHVHSHNSMAVFFSGTDTSELADNSEFHNHYLSLIVNNANDMECRVGFRIERSMRISSVVKYRNHKGDFVEAIGEEEEASDTVVGWYHVDVIKPEKSVPDEFIERLIKVEEEKKAKKLLVPAKTGTTTGKTGTHNSGKNNQNRKSYGTQPGFYGKGMGGFAPGEGWTPHPQGELFDVETNTWKDTDEDQNIANKWNRNQQSKKDIRSETPNYKGISEDVNKFFIRLIAQNSLYSGLMGEALSDINKQYKTGDMGLITYTEQVAKSMLDFYMDHFPEDTHLVWMNARIKDGIQHMRYIYGVTYNLVVSELTESMSSKLYSNFSEDSEAKYESEDFAVNAGPVL